MKTTGMNDAASMPAGSTIERVDFAVPTNSALGNRFPTLREAIAEAVKRRTEEMEKHAAHHGIAHAVLYPLPTRFYVDVRWLIRRPDQSTIDAVAERYEFESVEDGTAMLDRMDRFAIVH